MSNHKICMKKYLDVLAEKKSALQECACNTRTCIHMKIPELLFVYQYILSLRNVDRIPTKLSVSMSIICQIICSVMHYR